MEKSIIQVTMIQNLVINTALCPARVSHSTMSTHLILETPPEAGAACTLSTSIPIL